MMRRQLRSVVGHETAGRRTSNLRRAICAVGISLGLLLQADRAGAQTLAQSLIAIHHEESRSAARREIWQLGQDIAAATRAGSDRLAAKGLPTRITKEWNGLVRQMSTMTYDTRRKLLRRESIADVNGDGNVGEYDGSRLETYTYDAQGLLVEYITDDSFDGRHTERYLYDANDRLVQATWEDDEELDGTIEWSGWWSYAYDDRGNVVRYSTDGDYEPAGVRLRSSITYDYDDRGNVVRQVYEYDWFADGVLDGIYVERSTYDQYNNIIEYISESDDDADGVPEAVAKFGYEWDARGQLLQSRGESDYGVDGVIDTRSVWTFTYDRDYLTRIYMQWDQDGDAVFEEDATLNFSYERRGDLLYETQVTEDAFGRYVTAWVLDNRDNLVERTVVWDDGADGVIDYQERYRADFDAHGNLLLEVEESAYEGDVWSTPLTTRYEY